MSKPTCPKCNKRIYERGQTYTPGDECRCSTTPSWEEEFEKLCGTAYCAGDIEPLRAFIQALLDHQQAEMASHVIKMADQLESECSQDGDKGTRQWKAFKGFRNTIRDIYQTRLSTKK